MPAHSPELLACERQVGMQLSPLSVWMLPLASFQQPNAVI